MAQRHLIAIVLLVGLVAHLAAAASTTTAKPKTTKPPPPKQQVEDPKTEETVRQIARDVVRQIEKDERNKEPWNKTFTGAEMADQFKELHTNLSIGCKGNLTKTLTGVVDAAIRPQNSITFEQYWTVAFRSLMKLAIYMGKELTVFSTFDYLLRLQGAAGNQEISDLPTFYRLVYQAYEQFVYPNNFCKNLEALAVLFLNDMAVFIKEQKS